MTTAWQMVRPINWSSIPYNEIRVPTLAGMADIPGLGSPPRIDENWEGGSYHESENADTRLQSRREASYRMGSEVLHAYQETGYRVLRAHNFNPERESVQQFLERNPGLLDSLSDDERGKVERAVWATGLLVPAEGGDSGAKHEVATLGAAWFTDPSATGVNRDNKGYNGIIARAEAHYNQYLTARSMAELVQVRQYQDQMRQYQQLFSSMGMGGMGSDFWQGMFPPGFRFNGAKGDDDFWKDLLPPAIGNGKGI